jgi:hypothetical protein
LPEIIVLQGAGNCASGHKSAMRPGDASFNPAVPGCAALSIVSGDALHGQRAFRSRAMSSSIQDARIGRDSTRARRSAPKRDILVPLAAAVCGALVSWGWLSRDELYLDAGFGLGYALGIAGTAMMVLLLGYSIRKRSRRLRSAGPIRHWFRVHMLLGLFGPVAVLFHSRFQLGSLNSSVALGCVLLVAGSGVVGRLIYPRIHHGLTGQRATLRELRKAVQERRGALDAIRAQRPQLAEGVEAFERLALERRGALSAGLALLRLGTKAPRLRREARGSLSPGGRKAVDAYLRALRRAAGFGFYERIFAWWHAFHMPLCVMLAVAATVHVVAVHMY